MAGGLLNLYGSFKQDLKKSGCPLQQRKSSEVLLEKESEVTILEKGDKIMKLICWLGLGLSLVNLSCTKKPTDSGQSSLKALKPESAAGSQPTPEATPAPIDTTHSSLALVPGESGEVRTPYRPGRQELRQLEALSEEAKTFAHLKDKPKQAIATYKKFCASCHGEEGQGGGLAGDNLPVAPTNFHEWNIKYGRTPELIALTTMNGRNDEVMPAFAAAMSREELWSVSYLVASWIEARPDNAKAQ